MKTIPDRHQSAYTSPGIACGIANKKETFSQDSPFSNTINLLSYEYIPPPSPPSKIIIIDTGLVILEVELCFFSDQCSVV